MVRFISGHNFMRRHRAVIDLDRTEECRLCEEHGTKEDSEHMFYRCPALCVMRSECFSFHFLPADIPASYMSWTVTRMGKFLSNPQLLELEEDDEEDLQYEPG